MAVIEVLCPACSVKLKASDNIVGKRVKCKKCQHAFRVPGPTPTTESADDGSLPTSLSVEKDGAVLMAEAVDVPATSSLVAAPGVPPAATTAAPSEPVTPPQAIPVIPPQAARPVPTAPPPGVKPVSGAKPVSAPAPSAATIPAPAPSSPPAKPASKPAAVKPAQADKPPPPATPATEAESLPVDDAPFNLPTPLNETADDNPFSFPDLLALNAEDEKPRAKDQSTVTENEKKRPKKKSPADTQDEAAARTKPQDNQGDTAETANKPRYQRPGETGSGTLKWLLFSIAIAAGAIALAATAIIVAVKQYRESNEQLKKNEKKEEPKAEPPQLYFNPNPSPKPPDNPSPKPPDNPSPKPPDNPSPKPPDNPSPKPPDTPKRALYEPSPEVRTFTVGKELAKVMLADTARAAFPVEVPVEAVRRVFPPTNSAVSISYIVSQIKPPGKDGKGEKLAVEGYSPKGRVSRAEVDSDGRPILICDVHVSINGVRFLIVADGKLTVWLVDGNNPSIIIPASNPYLKQPEHQKAGIAAAFFSPDPDRVVVVSTAGVVHLFDLKDQKLVSEFVPPYAVSGKVALGKSVAASDGDSPDMNPSGHKSIVLAVGGVVYQIETAPGLNRLRTYDLGGDVAQSLALAVSGTPGRILYAFETAKKVKAVLCLPPGMGKPVVYRWPAAGVSEPQGAFWANERYGAVITDRGAVWFYDEDQIAPLVMTRSRGVVHQTGNYQNYWYVVAHPMKPMHSVLVGLEPFAGVDEYQQSFTRNQPLRAVQIDEKGLSK